VNRRLQKYFLYTLASSVGIWLAWSGIHTAVIKGAPEIHMSIPGGQMTDRNDFLVAGTGCVPLLAFVGWHYDGPWQKWIRRGTKLMVLCSLFAFFGSLSRGAVVGLSALALFYAIGTGRIFKRAGLVFVLVAIALPLVPLETWERLSTIEVSDQQSEASAYHRVEHMKAAVRVTFDHPLTGVGPQNFPRASQGLGYQKFASEPHSLWLKCSSEFGLTLFLVFTGTVIWAVLRLLGRARRARREKDGESEGMATALCCSIVGFLATGTFTSQFLSEYLWCIIALAAAFLATERDSARRPAAGTAAEAEEAIARPPEMAGVKGR
jgi:O-antigen ligase